VYRLTQLALARKSVTLLLAAGVFVGGLLAWGQLKAELLPDIDFPVATVIAVYPGAGTTDVAEQVSAPIERTLSGIQGVNSVRSTSSPSLAVVVAEFEYGTDIEAAIADIESSLATSGLPATVEPQVSSLNINAFPVSGFTVQANDPDVDVGKVVREEVVPELAGLPGIASVSVTGGDLERVEVVLDPVELARNGISVQQIAGILQANEISIPSGTIVEGDTTLPVTTSHRFTTIDQIRDLVVGYQVTPTVAPVAPPTTGTPVAPVGPVAPPAPPTPITLDDLGSVDFAPDPASGTSRTNGQPSVGISIIKASDANTIDATEAVEETMAELDAELGLTTTTVFRSADFIEQSIEGLLREGALGAVMAVLVIFLFLLSVRSTIVAAISIPLSVMAALLLMLVGGVSLNIMTLGGLAVAVGRVVDDAIVVLENIFRHHRANREPIGVAVLEGTKEVSSAITSSTITTVAVFLPIAFVGGLVSQFFLTFSLTVTFALLASLICALTVVPVLAYYLVPRVKHAPGAGEPGNKDTWVQRLYTPLLLGALRFRWVTLGVAGLLFVVAVGAASSIPTAFLNAGSDEVIQVSITPPPGTTESATLARAIDAEAIIDQDLDVESYQTSMPGSSDSDNTAFQSFLGTAAGSATIIVNLAPGTDLDAQTEEFLDALAPVATDGYSVRAGTIAGGGSGLQVIVSSEDEAALASATSQITAAVSAIDGIVNVQNDLAEEAPELQIEVDPTKAIAVGSTTAQLAQEVRNLLLGQTPIRPTLDGRVGATPVFVRVDPESIEGPDSIRDLLVGTVQKQRVADVATITEVDSQATVTRVDQSPAATITGDILAEDTGGASAAVQTAIDGLGLPPTVTVELAGITQQQTEGFTDLGFAMLVSIAVVYIVMVIVFGSLLDPFIILFSLPLAVIGAIAALLITGLPLGISAMIGMLMLIGIVVTNAIVLLDLVEQLRRKGYSVEHALYHAGRTRVRPILMTALATILALLPLALGVNKGSIIAAELGTVVIGGLFSSTLLTLVVVPVVYSLTHGGRMRLARILDRGGQDEQTDAAPLEAPTTAPQTPVA
jgi:hydrophobic/amphiphilic exporter-1 (mainly G- bacteria), HAE1 family